MTASLYAAAIAASDAEEILSAVPEDDLDAINALIAALAIRCGAMQAAMPGRGTAALLAVAEKAVLISATIDCCALDCARRLAEARKIERTPDAQDKP
jgi:hypothetical protein